uniref:Uncharacterized protein n=1 Tax=Anguilla anguilla TaxID=7936 RepID=A0A0E9TGR3_ANGAN
MAFRLSGITGRIHIKLMKKTKQKNYSSPPVQLLTQHQCSSNHSSGLPG